MQQKEKKREKRKAKKNPKIEKPKDVFDFCACPNHNVAKRDAGGKKGKLL